MHQSRSGKGHGRQTILQQDIETLLHKQIGVENDQSEGERKDVIARADLEEIPNRIL
jgi:hypothetical protein